MAVDTTQYFQGLRDGSLAATNHYDYLTLNPGDDGAIPTRDVPPNASFILRGPELADHERYAVPGDRSGRSACWLTQAGPGVCDKAYNPFGTRGG